MKLFKTYKNIKYMNRFEPYYLNYFFLYISSIIYTSEKIKKLNLNFSVRYIIYSYIYI